MSRNLEAKITKQMRELIEAKIKKQHISPEQAISDMEVFMGDFDDNDKHLIHQYAKYIKHLIDNSLETRNAWEKFLDKVEEHKLSHQLGKAVKQESLSDKEAFKQSLEDLKEYDKISKILKSPSSKAKKIEDITVANKDDNEVFNPFDEQAAADLADLEAVENDHDDWTLNDEEFEEHEVDSNDLGTLERNIEFSDSADAEQLKEEFSKIKSKMQAKIDDLTQQVEALKFKLADYQIKELDDYEIADESDDELDDKLLAQKVPEGQQTMDFSVDHTNEKLEDIKPEEPKKEDEGFAKTEDETISLDDLDELLDEKPEEESKPDDSIDDELLKTSEQTTVFTEPDDENTVDLEEDMAKGLSEALGEEIQPGEIEPTAVFGFDSKVVDKNGTEYSVAGSRKNSENHTEYLVRNEDGETFTIRANELKKK